MALWFSYLTDITLVSFKLEIFCFSCPLPPSTLNMSCFYHTYTRQNGWKGIGLTPSAYWRNLLLVSFLSKFSRYLCLWASTVSTLVLCFTASSRALCTHQTHIYRVIIIQIHGPLCNLCSMVGFSARWNLCVGHATFEKQWLFSYFCLTSHQIYNLYR